MLDSEGKSVGCVTGLVLHPDSREVVAVVVQQGILDRRCVVVPLNKIESFDGQQVRLRMRASELEGLPLHGQPGLRPMPDHWPMPAGFDLRSLFLVPDAWTTSMLPFQMTSPAASGTPAYVNDPGAEQEREPVIAPSTEVYDSAGERVGDVHAVDVDPATGRITRLIVRRGRLFHTETAIPAGAIASVSEDRITLGVRGDDARKFGRAIPDELGRAPAA